MKLKFALVPLIISVSLAFSSNADAGFLPGGASKKIVGTSPSSVFREDQSGSIRIRGIDSIKLPAGKLDFPKVPASLLLADNPSEVERASSPKRRMLVSILLSAALPGMGEAYLYMGSKDAMTLVRVPIFLTAEAYFWYGYFHNHRLGKDYKQRYMDYADEHWSLERFLLQHPCCDAYGGCKDYNFYNENCQGEFNYFLFTPKGIDEEEYYENIGKYDAFVYGWDDWDGQPDYWTPNRRYYWDLRKESDKYLVKGDNFLMYLLINRVVSMVDAGWLAYRLNRGDDVNKGWSVNIRSIRYTTSIEVGYRF